MWNKAKIMRLAERAMKRTAPYLENRAESSYPEDNFQLGYVLVCGKGDVPDDVIAYAGCMDEMLVLHPLTSKVLHMGDWGFSFDGDLFEYLEQGYDLVRMSLEFHCEAWSDIEAFHDSGEIEHLQGMQQYLNYCKRNKVTAELLRTKVGYNGMDVMALYDKSAVREKPSQEQER